MNGNLNFERRIDQYRFSRHLFSAIFNVLGAVAGSHLRNHVNFHIEIEDVSFQGSDIQLVSRVRHLQIIHSRFQKIDVSFQALFGNNWRGTISSHSIELNCNRSTQSLCGLNV